MRTMCNRRLFIVLFTFVVDEVLPVVWWWAGCMYYWVPGGVAVECGLAAAVAWVWKSLSALG